MKVSVIIPTYNRPKRVSKTLDALAAQTLPHNEYEVILVDDGSDVSLHSIAERNDPFFLHILRQKNSGATLARNHGASKSHGELLVFIDDDIRLHPTTLARLAEVLSENLRSVVMGALILPTELQTSPFAKLQSGHVVDDRIEKVHWSETMTGLLALRAIDFEEIKRFRDPTGGWPNWDDVDFGYRADAIGFDLLRCYDAVAEHWDYSIANVQEMGQRYQRAAASAVRLFERYPRMIQEMPMFNDKLPISWRQDSLTLIVRKLFRPILSSPIAMSLLSRLITFCERRTPRPNLLEPLYRWLIGGYIYQGWRTGLANRRQLGY